MSHKYPSKKSIENFLKEKDVDINNHGFEDHWIQFDKDTDLNLWTDDSKNEHITAFPMETLEDGTVQTNCTKFKKII